MQNPIILFGTGRSGTTILMDALFCHKEIAFFPNYLERKPDKLILNHIRSLHDNNIFRILKKRNNSFGHKLVSPFVSKPVEGYNIWRHILPEHINFSRSYLQEFDITESEKKEIYEYLDKLVSIQNRSRLALKITGPGRLKFLSEVFPNAKFIWLKRNFIPTLNSFLEVDFYKNRKTEYLWWESEKLNSTLQKMPSIKNNPILLTAFQLQAIIDDIQNSIESLDLSVLTVEYEDFTSKPTQTLKEVLNFCELKADKDCFNFLRNTKISNRNKADDKYFDDTVLSELENLRGELKASNAV